MALSYSVNVITGLAADTKPENVPYGVLFLETDTSNIFWYKMSGWVMLPPPGGGGALTLIPFMADLGVARSSGSFDLTGLSGLSVDASVVVLQTSAPITSKGNARDEGEMDRIMASGYVVDATTIRVYWQAPSVVVGAYNFGYAVSA